MRCLGKKRPGLLLFLLCALALGWSASRVGSEFFHVRAAEQLFSNNYQSLKPAFSDQIGYGLPAYSPHSGSFRLRNPVFRIERANFLPRLRRWRVDLQVILRALPRLMYPAALPQRLEADCLSSFAAGINALLHPARDTATLEPL
jgi:hypothetical protein